MLTARIVFITLGLLVLGCSNGSHYLSTTVTPTALNESEPTPVEPDYSEPPTITPSNVLESLDRRREESPSIGTEQLANYGNELLANQGLNFRFNTCEIAEANENVNEHSDDLRIFNFRFFRPDGGVTPVRILHGGFGAPCGCVFELPVTYVTDGIIAVLINGTPTEFVRPKGFYTEDVELVDESLTRTIRKWVIPDELAFVEVANLGISNDKLKIYFATGIKDLDLEILTDGTFKFVPSAQINKTVKGKELRNFPKDPNNSYLGYKRFEDGTIIKFTYPCT